MRSRPDESRTRLARIARVGASGLLILVAGGCAQSASKGSSASDAPAAARTVVSVAPEQDVETLRQRAAAFWAARVSGDVNGQWQVLEPRGKARMTPADYAGAPGAVKYIAYQVEDATVKGYFATVKVRLVIQPILLATRTSPVAPASVVVEDKWVRIQGIWYRMLEQE